MSLLGKEWYGEFIAHKDGFKEGVEEGFKVGYEAAKKEFGERKTGKWHYYRCSECKCLCTYFLRGSYVIDIENRPNYCPHCGAKMEVPDE